MCREKDETKNKINALIAAMDRLTLALQLNQPIKQAGDRNVPAAT